MITVGDTEAYDVTEMAEILHLSEVVIRRYCNQGKIPGAQKIGKNWYVSKDNLEAYLQGKTGTSKA